MDRKQVFACVIAFIWLAGCGGKKHIAVGSKNFTEQVILGEILAQHIEHRMGNIVDRKLNLGGTMVAHQAILSREIDLYPEYTGTAFSAVLKHVEVVPAAVLWDRIHDEYISGMQMEWIRPYGFNNSFAMVVRGDDARSRHLGKLSDAARDPKGFTLGVGYEFQERQDGYASLNSHYPLHWTSLPKTMDLGLLYQALKGHDVSMVAANTTDGILSAEDFKVLEDDKHAFGPYEACTVVRSDTIAEFPALRKTLEDLVGKISSDQMRRMNYEVDGHHRAVPEVASEFLNRAGLQ